MAASARVFQRLAFSFSKAASAFAFPTGRGSVLQMVYISQCPSSQSAKLEYESFLAPKLFGLLRLQALLITNRSVLESA